MAETADDSWRWRFRSQLIRVIDGDTVRLRLDYGFHCEQEHNIRLLGINCPELNTDAGKAARDFVEDWFLEHFHALEWPIVVVTERDKMTFNRYLGVVSCAEGHPLADAIVQAGHGALA